jgi:hypothetical protein
LRTRRKAETARGAKLNIWVVFADSGSIRWSSSTRWMTSQSQENFDGARL